MWKATKRKRGTNLRKKLLWLLCATMLTCSLTACGDEEISVAGNDGSNTQATVTQLTGKPDNASGGNNTTRSSINMSLDNDALNIERLKRDNIVPMGKDGTWSIFVYLCGSDLESNGGYATYDMQEMIDASTDSRIKYIVQTGGAKSWDNDVVSGNKIERYEICNGNMTKIMDKQSGNMGQSSELTDFLKWGVTTYPAKNMGVIFWNHGGGSIQGVCFDEKYDYDSLTLREIDSAFLSVYDNMTDNFRFVGFDACLMATVETANVLASYADYMYASEETEPGYGWNYYSIGEYLNKNPNADGLSLGKVVVDSFYDDCKSINSENGATLSVIDLSKIDNLIVSFNEFAKDIYEKTEDSNTYTQVVRSILIADNFGGNNKSEGYTNMVDIGSMVEVSQKYSDAAGKTLKALEDCVVYMKNGSDHKYASGIATYYPLSVQGSNELSTFGTIAVSPYYLAFVDRAAYGTSNSGDMSGYKDDDIFDFWGLFDYILDDSGEYGQAEPDDYEDYWSYYDDYEVTGDSPLISFDYEPQIFEDGSYGFVLTEDALWNTASVQANVYVLSEDMEDIIEYGISTDIYMDWEYGEFYDNFDGYWFSLPDGQNLAVYIESECDGYDVYTSPVELNGAETNLKIIHDYENGDVWIEGYCDGISEYGMASKTYKLNKGDVIVPLYYAYSIESEDEYIYYGDEYVYDGDPEIWFDWLYDGDYLYGFFIDDVYGDYYETDYVWFTVDGEDIYYHTDDEW